MRHRLVTLVKIKNFSRFSQISDFYQPQPRFLLAKFKKKKKLLFNLEPIDHFIIKTILHKMSLEFLKGTSF